MAFKQKDGLWVPDLPEFKLGTEFCAGDWNMGTGGGQRFVPEMRKPLDLAQKARLLKQAGINYIEFHDTEAPPEVAKNIMKVIRGEGLKVGMCTANLFKRPEFVLCNFGHPDAAVREKAIQYTKTYIRTGIEIFESLVYVYWNGSNGILVPLGNDYVEIWNRTADCLSEIVSWMIDEYGEAGALPICIEPKKNEPVGWGVPGDAAEALAIINLMPSRFRPFVGLNIETCHSQMGGKRFAMELGLAAACSKLWYIHLNGGSCDPKFDEDHAFGDVDFGVAVEAAFTLQQVGYTGLIPFDVQPLQTDTNEQQAETIMRSKRNFKRALACAKRINPVALKNLQLCNDQAGIAELFAEAVSGIEL